MFTRTKRLVLAALSLLLTATSSHAANYLISSDTYIDSYAWPGFPNSYSIDKNYGNSQVIKAVINNGVGTSYAVYRSLVHGLFTIESSFWSDPKLQNLKASDHVYVNYFLKNNSLNPAGEVKDFTRGLAVAPLTRGFVEGAGGSSSSSMAGTTNPGNAATGADWLSYDGIAVHTWDTPGGDYNSAYDLAAVITTVDGLPAVQIDLADWFRSADATARTLAQQYGMLIRTTPHTPNTSEEQYDQNFVDNDFVSLYSRGATGTSTPQAPITRPYITIVVPEPTALAMAGVFLFALRRPARRDSI